MTTLEREPDRNLDYVAVRMDGAPANRRESKNDIQELSRRIDRTNERIDRMLLAALVGIGGLLVVTVLGGFVALSWAILQSA